jgi:hypothetical protein
VHLVPLCTMTLTFLMAICLFECFFYLYVLFQWMLDKERKPMSRQLAMKWATPANRALRSDHISLTPGSPAKN